MDRPVEVIAYSGGRGEERPTAVRLGARRMRVVAWLGRWVETGMQPGTGIRRWSRVQLEDGQVMTVYYDQALERWFCREDPRVRRAGEQEEPRPPPVRFRKPARIRATRSRWAVLLEIPKRVMRSARRTDPCSAAILRASRRRSMSPRASFRSSLRVPP